MSPNPEDLVVAEPAGSEQEAPNPDTEVRTSCADKWKARSEEWKADSAQREGKGSRLGEAIKNGWSAFKKKASETATHYGTKLVDYADSLVPKAMNTMASVDQRIDSATTSAAEWMAGRVNDRAKAIGEKADPYLADAEVALKELDAAQKQAHEAVNNKDVAEINRIAKIIAEKDAISSKLLKNAEYYGAKADRKLKYSKLTLGLSKWLKGFSGI